MRLLDGLLKKDVADHVKRCTACTVYQAQANRTPREPVASKAKTPYDIIAVDLTGRPSVFSR